MPDAVTVSTSVTVTIGGKTGIAAGRTCFNALKVGDNTGETLYLFLFICLNVNSVFWKLAGSSLQWAKHGTFISGNH